MIILILKYGCRQIFLDENQIIFNNNPIEFCQILAHEKAKNVAMKNGKFNFIIGADTIVVEKNVEIQGNLN